MVAVITSILFSILQAASTAPAAKTGPLIHEGIVDAPVAKVWDAFTTAEGIKSWMAPHADIDLRVGGKMRSNYNPDGMLGDGGTIENTILSFEPQRMLSIKATKPPENFPFKDSIGSMWSVLYFEAAGPARTKVRLVGMGYADDAESQKLRDFFDKGNAYTLKKLQEKFEKPGSASNSASESDEAGRVLAFLGRFVGGEWISDNKGPDGAVFRVRNIYTLGPDGKSLVARGWLGNAEGMHEHGATQIWREPSAGGGATVRFQNLDEHGSLARGEIRMLDPQTTEWDWTSINAAGKVSYFRVHIRVESEDSYQLKIDVMPNPEAAAGGSAPREMVNVKFNRVKEAPAEFLKLRSAAAKQP